MRRAWGKWQKLSENLTDLPKLIRLLNSRLQDLAIWASTAIPGESAAAMPAAGTWTAGYYVENSAPAVLGGAGNQYIVKGWKRLTSGQNNVLNVDWVECRTLTGT